VPKSSKAFLIPIRSDSEARHDGLQQPAVCVDKLSWTRAERSWPSGPRYLWTDVFGVVLLVSLYAALEERRYLDEAEWVVVEVDRVLGRSRGIRMWVEDGVPRLNAFFESYRSGDEYDREAITHVMACSSHFPGYLVRKLWLITGSVRTAV
jgi:hypothetical protein